jgi:hypothetical protein
VRVDGLGRIWVPDQLNHAVRRVTPAGEVSTVAGSGKAGYIDGATTAARFNNPTGIAPLLMVPPWSPTVTTTVCGS